MTKEELIAKFQDLPINDSFTVNRNSLEGINPEASVLCFVLSTASRMKAQVLQQSDTFTIVKRA